MADELIHLFFIELAYIHQMCMIWTVRGNWRSPELGIEPLCYEVTVLKTARRHSKQQKQSCVCLRSFYAGCPPQPESHGGQGRVR